PARAAGLRQPALARYRDPGVPREPRRPPADRARPSPRELSPGVSPSVGESDLVRPPAARPAAAQQHGPTRASAAGRRLRPRTTPAAAVGGHGRQSLLSGRERADPGRDGPLGRSTGGVSSDAATAHPARARDRTGRAGGAH